MHVDDLQTAVGRGPHQVLATLTAEEWLLIRHLAGGRRHTVETVARAMPVDLTYLAALASAGLATCDRLDQILCGARLEGVPVALTDTGRQVAPLLDAMADVLADVVGRGRDLYHHYGVGR